MDLSAKNGNAGHHGNPHLWKTCSSHNPSFSRYFLYEDSDLAGPLARLLLPETVPHLAKRPANVQRLPKRQKLESHSALHHFGRITAGTRRLAAEKQGRD